MATITVRRLNYGANGAYHCWQIVIDGRSGRLFSTKVAAERYAGSLRSSAEKVAAEQSCITA